MAHQVILYSYTQASGLAEVVKQLHGDKINDIFNINCGRGFTKGYELGYLHKLKDKLGMSSLYDVVLHCYSEDKNEFSEIVALASVGMDGESMRMMMKYLKKNSSDLLGFSVLFLIDKTNYYYYFDEFGIMAIDIGHVAFREVDVSFRISDSFHERKKKDQ